VQTQTLFTKQRLNSNFETKALLHFKDIEASSRLLHTHFAIVENFSISYQFGFSERCGLRYMQFDYLLQTVQFIFFHLSIEPSIVSFRIQFVLLVLHFIDYLTVVELRDNFVLFRF
jgi:hypothetical protein